MIYADRVSISIVGPASDEAADRLYSCSVSRLAFKLGGEIIRHLTKFRRLFEPIKLKWLAEKLGCTEGSASRAIKELVEAGVIGWKSSRGQGTACYIALARHYLPTSNMSEPDVSNMSTTDITEQKIDKRVKEERESAPPLPAVTSEEKPPLASVPAASCAPDVRAVQTTPAGRPEPAPVPVPDGARWGAGGGGGTESWGTLASGDAETSDVDPSATDGCLAPDEEHETDAMFAADRLATHLFGGLPDPSVRSRMYRRFLAAPIGSCTRVLELTLLGNPARTIDYPASYAAVWIDNAVEKLLTTGAQLLTPDLVAA